MRALGLSSFPAARVLRVYRADAPAKMRAATSGRKQKAAIIAPISPRTSLRYILRHVYASVAVDAVLLAGKGPQSQFHEGHTIGQGGADAAPDAHPTHGDVNHPPLTLSLGQERTKNRRHDKAHTEHTWVSAARHTAHQFHSQPRIYVSEILVELPLRSCTA